MDLTPFQSVNGLSFGLAEKAIIEILGDPESEGLNAIGDLELRYKDLLPRFSTDEGMLEVSFNASTLSIGGHLVTFSGLQEFIRANDPESVEALGFIVSPKLGLAFDPDNPFWVSAFSKKRLNLWLELTQPNHRMHSDGAASGPAGDARR